MNFLLVVFVGAFLLFQIQPMIAKIILPYFGGGASVWTACMLFFQAFLLAGYLYAHFIGKLEKINAQLFVHCGLLLISAFLLPVSVDGMDSVNHSEPLITILLTLTSVIGLPYLMLSATGPMVQHWFSVTKPDSSPYFLYSWSNIASLLALLSFPFVVEPSLTSSMQLTSWSMIYFGFIALMFVLAWQVKGVGISQAKRQKNQQLGKANINAVVYWLLFSCLGVIFLVATTSAMTQNVAPIPFLWILPLCLYLLTFIICFQRDSWYVRWYWLLLLALSAFIAIFLHFIGSQFNLMTQIALYSCVLFSACMVCHGELVKSKPQAQGLTLFYLSLSVGGFLGSVLVAFVATHVFSSFIEFPLAFCLLFFVVGGFIWHESSKQRKLSVMLFSLAGLSLSLLLFLQNAYQQSDVTQSRNFYGVLAVKDVVVDGELQRRLIDGTTSHGTQSQVAGKEQIPLSYYRENTGGALAIDVLQANGPLNAAFVGLGAGALAAYGNADDNFTFYELNPAVIDAAKRYFTFLEKSPATIELVQGDARVSLTKIANDKGQKQAYDLIVLDAFSGDSIPQHLLTIEALSLYQQLLSEDGIIAVHISNSHLNLLPLMVGLAQAQQWQLLYFHSDAQNEVQHNTDWVWLTKNQQLTQLARVKLTATSVNLASIEPTVWTDDFSELMSLLK